jgi:hypothetical protein
MIIKRRPHITKRDFSTPLVTQNRTIPYIIKRFRNKSLTPPLALRNLWTSPWRRFVPWANPTLNFFKSTAKVSLKAFASSQNKLKFDIIVEHGMPPNVSLNFKDIICTRSSHGHIDIKIVNKKFTVDVVCPCLPNQFQVKYFWPFLESVNPENFDT